MHLSISLSIYIYLSIHIYLSIYLSIYVYIYNIGLHESSTRSSTKQKEVCQVCELAIYLSFYIYLSIYNIGACPLQDVILVRGCCAPINHPFLLRAHLHCPPWCNTIARLLGSIRPRLRRPVCMPYTIPYW